MEATDFAATADRLDTLRYRLVVHRSVPQEDIRLSVRVTALVRTDERDQRALEKKVRTALGTFVDTDWTLASIQRAPDAMGYERLNLVAFARVHPRENYNLNERARAASAEGLQLSQPGADYSLSPDRMNEIVSALQDDAIARLRADVARFTASTGREWRIGDVEFGANVDYPRASGKGAVRDEDLPLFCREGDQEGVSGAERVSLIVSVVLKARG